MITVSPVNNKRIIIFFFAVICLITTFAIKLHHHDDNLFHFDCPLCIVENALSSGITETNVSFVFCLVITFFIQPQEENFHRTLFAFSIFLSRAPPLSLPA
jgi:hypothetical protein